MKTVAFICIHNSCRSQMAEGWANHLGSDVLTVYSAGSIKYHQVKPKATQVMLESGIDISAQYPKLLSSLPHKLDFVITMGCGVECPFIVSNTTEDWGIEDPSGKETQDFRVTRDIIKNKVIDLIAKVKLDV